MRNLARNGSLTVRNTEQQSGGVSRERGLETIAIGVIGIGAVSLVVEKCITIGEPFYPVERDNESSFCVLYENAPEGFREIERNRRYIFTDDKLTANLFALAGASPRAIKYS